MPLYRFAVLDAHCLGKPVSPANLPTCGGDARQGRGGCHTVRRHFPGSGKTKRPEGVTLPAFVWKSEPIRRLRSRGPCGPLRPSGCRWRAAGRRSGRCCG
ncbi:hypothetical protein EFR84_00770 [Rhizobium chutanense]|uniref:Uncharacterized protein n=1 Tax=Rhizobium chutanense TaxID=2035448 RepID=A0A432P9Q0_9HYPH|nr:hypothetical protein EFR84_00770 [Rhizobium chutanense]